MTSTPRATIAARIETDFGRRLEALRTAAARTTARADDEAIHDVRVATRRLGALLRVWGGALDPDARAWLRRRLRRLRRRLGAARELEVHVAQLAARAPDESLAPRLAIEGLLGRLTARRDRARRRAARRTRPRRMARLLERLETARSRFVAPPLELPATGAPPAPAVPAPDPLAAAHRQVDALAARARDVVRHALARRDDEALHAARIAIKGWRYAVETVRTVAGEEPREATRALAALQESLGEIHDAAVLRDLLRRAARRHERDGAPATAATLRAVAERLEAERVAAVGRFAALADQVPAHDDRTRSGGLA
jgi:CHAD domain-containing protein